MLGELELRSAIEELLPYVNVEEVLADLRRMVAEPRFHGQINRQAQAIVDDILSNPGTTFTKSFRGRFGDTLEVTAPDGRGIVYDANGRFLFFKE